MRRSRHNRKKTRKKHRQTNRRRTRITRRIRRKMKGSVEAKRRRLGGGGEGTVVLEGDIKQALECNMQKYSSDLGENDNFGVEQDRNTILCIEKIKAIRPLKEGRRSIFMTTGFSYCYMFEEFIDEDNIMFCDWRIKSLMDTKKYVKYGISRRNYELSKEVKRDSITIDKVISDGGIERWYNNGPLPRKKYIFLHMNLNDNKHVTTLLETINSLGCTITTNNLSNVNEYIPGAANEQPYYRFFGNEPAINTNCMYICGIYGYHFNKQEILEILGKRNQFYDISDKARVLQVEFGEQTGPGPDDYTHGDARILEIYRIEFDKLWAGTHKKPDILGINLDSNCTGSAGQCQIM